MRIGAVARDRRSSNEFCEREGSQTDIRDPEHREGSDAEERGRANVRVEVGSVRVRRIRVGFRDFCRRP